MKKALSLILCLCMLASLVVINVSAAEGDVLYKANFKGDDKFAPAAFGCLKGEEFMKAVPSEDGSAVTVTYTATAAGRAFWGGTVKGLTYGEGKTYTIKTKMAVATYMEGETLKSGNAGVFINMPDDTSADALLNSSYKNLIGYYGCPNIRQTLSYGAGGKSIGKLISGDAYITDVLFDVDSEGFVDLAFLVEGKTVKVFINNIYIDEYDAFNAGMLSVADNIGVSVYLYNPEAAITLKDYTIYEGNTVTGATYPTYYKEGAAVTNYDTAKTGDVLFSADFSRADTGFAPRFLASNVDKYKVTLDPAKKNYVKFENTGTAAGTYFGSTVTGLDITTETRYTTEWKVKTGAQNSGFSFAVPTALPLSNSFNIYGNFTAEKMSMATEHGSTKIGNVNTPGKDYVPVTDLGYDADGYATFRAEMDGYKATIYYLNAEGKWISYNVIDMAKSVKFDGTTEYPHDAGFQVCIGFYLHNKNLVAEYKDMVVYKGLTVSDPNGLRDPAPTPSGDATVMTVAFAVATLCLGAVVIKKRISER